MARQPFPGAVHVSEHWRKPPGPRFGWFEFLTLFLLVACLFGGAR